MTRTSSSGSGLVSCLVLALLAAGAVAPRPAAGQDGSRGGFELRKAVLGGGLGLVSGFLMAGPAGDAVITDDDGSALIGAGLAGIVASFIPYPEGTRVRLLVGPGFYSMGDLSDLYENISDNALDFDSPDDPGLGIESSVEVDIPIGDDGWGWGFQVGVANDAASVTVNQPTAGGIRTRDIAKSTAQAVLVGLQGIRRFGGRQGPVALKAVAGGGYSGLSTDTETQAEFGPWGEVVLEAGGFIGGGGPTFQVGGRYHVVSDLDFEPIGEDAVGTGEADFGGFFIRMGWTW